LTNPSRSAAVDQQTLETKTGGGGKKNWFLLLPNMGTLLLPNQKVCGVDGVDKQNASVLE
jgi:hypothetical protein